jgi:dihydrofolate reductase
MTVLLDMAISVDGFVAGQASADAGLHDWYFATSSEVDQVVVRELVGETGALVMGRNSYELAMRYGGLEDTPYRVPHYVLTHREPDRRPQFGPGLTFVTDGLGSCIEQARRAAASGYVTIGGGADVARQCIDAALVDEIELHVVPKLLGSGLRLFTGSERTVHLERIREIAGEGASHIRYRAHR